MSRENDSKGRFDMSEILTHLKIKFHEPLFGSQPNNSVAHRTTRKLPFRSRRFMFLAQPARRMETV
jgi:hypothetical protein